jgi:protein arginine kinase activator
MKCQKCNKSATFHITDLTGDGLLALHLCPDCAKHYLQPEAEEVETPKITGVLSDQLKLEQTAEELEELDSRKCPICGISFKEFRKTGRLGCPHDYVYFGKELKPLLESIHGSVDHIGKRPQHGAYDAESQTELIRLRGEMKLAVSEEDYEKAQEIRDRIRTIEDRPG